MLNDNVEIVEIGATEAVQQHLSRHVVATKPVSQRKLDFEHARYVPYVSIFQEYLIIMVRPRWLRECMAEATGVFFYVYVLLNISYWVESAS